MTVRDQSDALAASLNRLRVYECSCLRSRLTVRLPAGRPAGLLTFLLRQFIIL